MGSSIFAVRKRDSETCASISAIRWAFVVGLLLIGPRVYAELKWAATLGMGHDLFPSFILATATMEKEPVFASPYAHQENTMQGVLSFGDWRKMAGIRVETSDPETKVRVVISSTRFIKPSKLDVTLKGGAHWIYPRLEFDYAALKAVQEPTPETITFRVLDFSHLRDGKPLAYSKTETVEIRSISDCPTRRTVGAGPTARHDNWEWMFAAYVNENSPIIDDILRDALQSRVIAAFLGYQQGEKGVIPQLFAVWNVLQRRGIKYSSITTPSGESDRVFSQTVRPIEESFRNQQANCVDGSVLFASIFRKIGLRTFLVTIPGHCFMGVYLEEKPGPAKPIFIETTLLGSTDLGQTTGIGRDLSMLDTHRKLASYSSFIRAINVAQSNVAKHGQTLHLWDVDQLRKLGLRPQ